MSEEHLAAERLRETFADDVEEVGVFRGETWVVVSRDKLLEVGRFLKEDPELAFDYLTLLTAVDFLPREPRFEVVYHLYSMTLHHRIVLKVRLPGDDPTVDSITSLWPTANWHEREAYDLMGIEFKNHPDLRRMFLPDDWEGHPLRKDYPLTGPQGSR
jgi:NADH-quinone oxidoreductase subunit C